MGVQIPVGYAQATLRWSVAGDSEIMVSTLGIYDGVGAMTPTQYANAWDAAYMASTLSAPSAWAAGWSIMTSMVTTMLASGPVTLEIGGALAGTGAAGSPPQNCAVLVRKQTPLGGRRNRGRMYLPPGIVLETNVNQVGTIDAAVVSTLQGRVNSLETQLTANALVPVLLHSDGGVPTIIDQFVIQPKIATQRTRLRR